MCALLGSLLFLPGCSSDRVPGAPPAGNASQTGKSPSKSRAESPELTAQIEAFCGACHAVPNPQSFPKGAWHEEVNKGFNFYFESGRTDLHPPAMVDVVTWFSSRAPKELPIPTQSDLQEAPKVPFRLVRLLSADNLGQSHAAVASLAWRPLSDGGRPELVFCDMRTGGVGALQPAVGRNSLRRLAELQNPCHAEICDLDRDGVGDLIVADLGSFLPQDHAKGRVVWLRGVTGGEYEPHVLLEGVGRVADVEPCDFDQDGDLDLVVAVFGWRKTGQVLVLENRSQESTGPEFVPHEIDPRHGAIHVPVADLDGNGLPDFVVLFSQEHESIELFLNEGSFRFRREVVFQGGDPAHGSTGIQLVDLDTDGDLDLLATNGDMFDTFFVKPYHGVRWLENTGSFPWKNHFLAELPGVHKALAGDIDGDGDLDIVAAVSIPETTAGKQVRPDFDAVIWLEQTAPGQFERHGILKGHGRFPSMELADFDEDGDLDVAIGAMRDDDHTPSVGVFWNDRIESRTGG
ncbi:MAG: FG-GAP repeat domain-containing protein [Planctomycetaceae bacterium]